jgi:hypothetical protein
MKRTGTQITISGEVVKTLELEPISLSEDGDVIRFRIEVIKDIGSPAIYRVRLWRLDFYRLKPTFPQSNGRPQCARADELVFVEATGSVAGVEKLRSKSISHIINKTLLVIAEAFGVAVT